MMNEVFWEPKCKVCGKRIFINSWEPELCEEHKREEVN